LLFGHQTIDAGSLKAALQRQWMIEFQFSQQWGHHANGTACMGPDPDNNVIGSDFRVHDIDNLWVISASSTPAADNPGTFLQLHVAGAIGETGSDAVGEQMRANENHLGRMSPLATRLPAESSSKNTLGENLLIAIDRARGHVGDSQGTLSAEALTQLIAMQKQRGFTADDVAFAETVVKKAEANKDPNVSMLRVLADETRKLKKDQSFALDIRGAIKSINVHGNHLTNDQALGIVDEVNDRERAAARAGGPPGGDS
jgi:hypothetical protein